MTVERSFWTKSWKFFCWRPQRVVYGNTLVSLLQMENTQSQIKRRERKFCVRFWVAKIRSSIVEILYYTIAFSKLQTFCSSKQIKSKEVKEPKQPSLAEAFEGHTPLAKSSARWKKLTNSVCYFLAKDMNPISTIVIVKNFTIAQP